MNYILFDDFARNNLLPLTFIRPIADLLTGIVSIRRKWEMMLDATTSSLTEDYLSEKYPLVKGVNNILINASIIPNAELVETIKQLEPNRALLSNDTIVALHVMEDQLDKIGEGDTEGIIEIETRIPFTKINYSWDLFRSNADNIAFDFSLLTKGRKSQPLGEMVSATHPERIFVEEGAQLGYCRLNATEGPIYIGREAQIWDGASLRGPVAIGEGAIVKMNAIVYGGTTIGPHAKAGGEIENAIVMAYSNKPHSGYLGHALIGEWCNLAAGTNAANLNNTYKTVKMWNYTQSRFIDTGLQFCGLIMGDHSKTGINTSFNTGSVVGVSSNIFGAGYQRNFVSSFMWGGPGGYSGYDIQKALDTASEMLKRRGMELTDLDEQILKKVYELTKDNMRL